MGEDIKLEKLVLITWERNIPKGGISCEGGANDEEPVSVFDDTITLHANVKCQIGFFCLEKNFKEKKKNFLAPVA
jgi:hypothetical protein